MDQTFVLYYFILFLCVIFTRWTPNSYYTKHGWEADFKYYLGMLMPILIYTIFWGLRYKVGADWVAYRNMFFYVPSYTHVEYGYLWFNAFLSNNGFSYLSIFIITSFISIFTLFVIARHENRNFAIFLVYFFFTTSLVFASQNGLRQIFAFNMVMISIHLLDNKNIKNYILITLILFIATTIHTSVFVPIAILVLLFLILPIEINKYLLICLVCFTNFLGQYLYDFILKYTIPIVEYLGYVRHLDKILNVQEQEYATGLGRLLSVFVNCVVIYNQDKVFLNEGKRSKYYYYCFFLIGIIILPIIKDSLIFARLVLYFEWVKFIVLAYLCVYFIGNRENTNKQILLWSIVFIQLLLYGRAILNNSNIVVPYQMIDIFNFYENLTNNPSIITRWG